jgi:hypothetical protein
LARLFQNPLGTPVLILIPLATCLCQEGGKQILLTISDSEYFQTEHEFENIFSSVVERLGDIMVLRVYDNFRTAYQLLRLRSVELIWYGDYDQSEET